MHDQPVNLQQIVSCYCRECRDHNALHETRHRLYIFRGYRSGEEKGVMTDQLRLMTERLVSTSNAICEEIPLAGTTGEDVLWIRKKFSAWKFPLPSELLDIWALCAGTPQHDYDHSLLKSPLGIKSLDEPDVDVIAAYDVERYDILNLGSGYEVSLTINRDGQVSLDPMAFDMQPESFPYGFMEGFTKYVEAIEAEVASGCYEEED